MSPPTFWEIMKSTSVPSFIIVLTSVKYTFNFERLFILYYMYIVQFIITFGFLNISIFKTNKKLKILFFFLLFVIYRTKTVSFSQKIEQARKIPTKHYSQMVNGSSSTFPYPSSFRSVEKSFSISARLTPSVSGITRYIIANPTKFMTANPIKVPGQVTNLTTYK